MLVMSTPAQWHNIGVDQPNYLIPESRLHSRHKLYRDPFGREIGGDTEILRYWEVNTW